MKKIIALLLALLVLAGCSSAAGQAQAGIGAGRYTSTDNIVW
ncbi:MAG: lipoprotein [Erysipelotrichaceae bacterium]|nr:lipoprotein [Erysipelotrichaceae bacterium]